MSNAKLTQTEQLIVDLTRQVERYKLALGGCLLGATHALRQGNEHDMRAALGFVKKEALEALYPSEEESE